MLATVPGSPDHKSTYEGVNVSEHVSSQTKSFLFLGVIVTPPSYYP